MTILGEAAIIRRRHDGTGSWGTDGRHTKSGTTDTAGVGSFQPPSGETLAMLDLGERARFARRLFTSLELRTTDQHTQVPADLVVVNSVVYKVVHVDPWSQVLPHFDATIVRVNE